MEPLPDLSPQSRIESNYIKVNNYTQINVRFNLSGDIMSQLVQKYQVINHRDHVFIPHYL